MNTGVQLIFLSPWRLFIKGTIVFLRPFWVFLSLFEPNWQHTAGSKISNAPVFKSFLTLLRTITWLTTVFGYHFYISGLGALYPISSISLEVAVGCSGGAGLCFCSRYLCIVSPSIRPKTGTGRAISTVDNWCLVLLQRPKSPLLAAFGDSPLQTMVCNLAAH